jgi:hypothetical protein
MLADFFNFWVLLHCSCSVLIEGDALSDCWACASLGGRVDCQKGHKGLLKNDIFWVVRIAAVHISFSHKLQVVGDCFLGSSACIHSNKFRSHLLLLCVVRFIVVEGIN